MPSRNNELVANLAGAFRPLHPASPLLLPAAFLSFHVSGSRLIACQNVVQMEYANEDVFISHAGPQKDVFAVHLRRELQRHGISAFLDERSIMRGEHSEARMQAACTGAKLMIFVVTCDFLRSIWCLKELRWALAKRAQGAQLPEILTVLYPSDDDTINIDDLSPLSSKLSAVIQMHAEAQHAWLQLMMLLGVVAVACVAMALAGVGALIAGGSFTVSLACITWWKQQRWPSTAAQVRDASRQRQYKLDLECLATLCVLRHDAHGR